MLFLYGLSSGKAMFNSEFNNSFDINNIIDDQQVENFIEKTNTQTKKKQLKEIESNSKPEFRCA